MFCPNCGTPYDSGNYCINCRCILSNTGTTQTNQKLYFQPQPIPLEHNKRDSTLSIIAAICALFTITCFIGFIIAIVDLAQNNPYERHLGSKFAIVFFLIAFSLFICVW